MKTSTFVHSPRDWFCDKCLMKTMTQHKHGDYVGVPSFKPVKAKRKSKRRKTKPSKASEKKLGRKLWTEYYEATKFIREM